MRIAAATETEARFLPAAWRMTLIAVCTLILCSCRSVDCPKDAGELETARGGAMALPDSAFTGRTIDRAAFEQMSASAPQGPCPENSNVPLPYEPQGPWSPDGLAKPWPTDEYLRDGGDRGKPAGVKQSTHEVLGLGMEDTVAHYQTADGCTKVQPSNEVHIYSPRFGAVRQVVGLTAYEERQRAGGVHEPQQLNAPTVVQLVNDMKQNVRPDNGISARPAVAMRSRQGDGVLSNAVRAKAFQDKFMPFENLTVLKTGVAESSEGVLLQKSSEAAISWNNTQAVQVILDRQSAAAVAKYDKTQLTYTVDSPPGCPRLQLVKVASTQMAKPGDTVDFTIRFDNVGTETIEHVTILDSLSTRLELVPNSGQCSVPATFSTAPNEGGSDVVRCEVADPLKPGQGGILRFSCRVR